MLSAITRELFHTVTLDRHRLGNTGASGTSRISNQYEPVNSIHVYRWLYVASWAPVARLLV